jgi:fructuronate reductase
MSAVLAPCGTPVHAPSHGRLSRASLPSVSPAVRRPAFDPAQLRPGILHLGCGSFHRAHQAWLTQLAIEEEMRTGSAPTAWGIAAVSLRTPAVTQALAAQDGLYTVLEHQADKISANVVGTLCRWIFNPGQPMLLRQTFGDPAVRLVTLTITVGGYCVDSATGHLDHKQTAIQDDLCHVHPHTAIGVLVEGLRRRRDAGIAPPVVLSCDNLPSNGRALRQVCIDYAALQDDRLSAWIAECVQFPSTMVDRIVPATSAQDMEDAHAATGFLDTVPVPAEPFHQWVIEHFDGPRPQWQAAGAEYVANVEPWEASKLRLLNGGHLVIACLGRLAGCETVAEVMDEPGFAAFIERFLRDEQKPTLPPSGHDIDTYSRQLLARFCNHGIVHRLDRIARDSSTKLAARLLDPLRQNRRAGRPAPCTVIAVAAWMRCVAYMDRHCTTSAPHDQLEGLLHRCGGEAARDPDCLVDRMLQIGAVFGEDLRCDAALNAALRKVMGVLAREGIRGAVARCMAGEMFGLVPDATDAAPPVHR